MVFSMKSTRMTDGKSKKSSISSGEKVTLLSKSCENLSKHKKNNFSENLKKNKLSTFVTTQMPYDPKYVPSTKSILFSNYDSVESDTKRGTV